MVEFKIVFVPETGDVTVTGPLQNKILCLGLLEEAKATVQAWHARQRETQIIPATTLPPDPRPQ